MFFIPQACFRAFRISYYLGRQIFKSLEANMWGSPEGTMGKCKALETALNNKLLSSHEHLKKGVFSPPCRTVISKTTPKIPEACRASGNTQALTGRARIF